MNNELDEYAQANVEISNIRATDDELEMLKNLIFTGLAGKATPPKVTSVSNDAKGSCYELTFQILNQKHYVESTITSWLYKSNLVGWSLNVTFVHP